MADQKMVEGFLRELKAKMKVYDVAFRPRDKNTATLAELEISPAQRLRLLESLTYKNYYTGPNKDTHDPSRPDYYEFGLKVKSREIYVKISLGLPNKMIDCMSFHIAERPIIYPFQKEEI